MRLMRGSASSFPPVNVWLGRRALREYSRGSLRVERGGRMWARGQRRSEEEQMVDE
jgi:hypothetical protein